MSQTLLHHPGDQMKGPLDPHVYESMFQVFANICTFWNNLENPENYRSRLYAFMDNRMKLRPQYRQYYQLAELTMKGFIGTGIPIGFIGTGIPICR